MRTLDSSLEALLRNRFQYVIDSIEVERLYRKVIVRSHEHDRGLLCQSGQRPCDRKTVEFGHGHVEQYKVGRQRLDQPQSLRAVACSPDHLEPRYAGRENLHTLYRERFIVDDKRAQVFVPLP